MLPLVIEYYVNHLEQEYSFLTEVDSIVIWKTLFNLENIFKSYFNKLGGCLSYKSKIL